MFCFVFDFGMKIGENYIFKLRCNRIFERVLHNIIIQFMHYLGEWIPHNNKIPMEKLNRLFFKDMLNYIQCTLKKTFKTASLVCFYRNHNFEMQICMPFTYYDDIMIWKSYNFIFQSSTLALTDDNCIYINHVIMQTNTHTLVNSCPLH